MQAKQLKHGSLPLKFCHRRRPQFTDEGWPSRCRLPRPRLGLVKRLVPPGCSWQTARVKQARPLSKPVMRRDIRGSPRSVDAGGGPGVS